jgi:Zn-dependent peptidase ImmA (M78 family)
MKKIKIFNQNWKVDFATGNELANIMRDNSPHRDVSYNGVCDPNSKEIYIYDGLDYESRKKTLTHELVHALIYEIGTDFEKTDEEIACKFFAFVHPEITRLLKDLDKWLGGGK